MDLSIDQVRACKDTVFICETCINALAREKIFNTLYVRSFKQCQDLCAAFLHAAATDSIYLEKIALLCIGLCEECIEICEDLQTEKVFKKAIPLFRNCSAFLLSTEDTSRLAYTQLGKSKK